MKNEELLFDPLSNKNGLLENYSLNGRENTLTFLTKKI